VNDPPEPVITTGFGLEVVLVVPSPQLMLALKALAASPLLVSVKVATVVELGSASPSTAEVSAIWPLNWPATCAGTTCAVLIALAAAVPGASSVTVTVTVSCPTFA